MNGEVLVPLLVTPVLGDKVQVVPSDDDGVGHLGRLDNSGKDSASDRDFTGEGALLVNVGTVDGLGGGLESKTDILVPTLGLGVDLLSAPDLGVVENGLLSEVLVGGLLHLACKKVKSQF